jgi:hypothetical protein
VDRILPSNIEAFSKAIRAKLSLSEILCVRHNMSLRSMYAKQDKQEESGGNAAQHSERVH